MRLLQPSLQIKVNNVGAQFKRQIGLIKMKVKLTIPTLHTLACIKLIRGVIISQKSVCIGQIPVGPSLFHSI
jgi:hypothetical protein